MAAFAVVLYHGSVVLRGPELIGVSPFGGLFEFGHAGVEFFFVLSGFIMVYVHRNDIGHRSRWADYARKRVTRIFPLFWFFMVIYAVKAIARGEFDLRYFFTSALLLPQPPYPLIGQSWTLSHELIFYVLFSSFIANRYFGAVAFSCWAIALLAAVATGEHQIPGDVLASYNLLFFFGLAVAWVLKRYDAARPILALAVGVGGIVCAGLAEDAGWMVKEKPVSVCLFGALSALVIVGLVSAERTGKLSVGRGGVLLGKLSYPLYLVHSTIIAALGIAVGRFGLAQGEALLSGYALVSCAAAYVVHRLVERPLQSATRKLTARWHSGASAAKGSRKT